MALRHIATSWERKTPHIRFLLERSGTTPPDLSNYFFKPRWSVCVIYLFQHHRRKAPAHAGATTKEPTASIMIEETRIEAPSPQTAIGVASTRILPDFERATDFLMLRDENGVALWERNFAAA